MCPQRIHHGHRHLCCILPYCTNIGLEQVHINLHTRELAVLLLLKFFSLSILQLHNYKDDTILPYLVPSNLQVDRDVSSQFDAWGLAGDSPLASALTEDDFLEMV